MRLNFFKQRKASSNYSIDMMPRTRKQVFKDICHLHLSKVFYIGLILLAFSLPIHIVDLTENILVVSLTENLSGVSSEAEINEIAYNVLALQNIVELIKIPLWLIFSIGLAGILRVVRQYCWIENVSIKHDFRIGVKQNAKQCVLVTLIFAFINYIANYLINNSYMVADQDYSVILFLPIAAEILIVLPIFFIIFVCISVYKNTFVQNLKVAITLLLNKYVIILLISSMGVLPLMVITELGFYPSLIIRLIYTLGGGFLLIGYCLFIYNVLDTYINIKYFPELVGKGTIWNEEI